MVELKGIQSVNARALAGCTLMFALIRVTTVLFNGGIDVVQSSIDDASRDWATIVQAILMAVIALVARHQPDAVPARVLTACGLVLIIAGSFASAIGVNIANPLLVVLGTCCRSAALVWATILALVMCAQLPFRWMFACIAGGGLLGTPLAVAVSPAGYTAQLVVYSASAAIALIVGTTSTRTFFEELAEAEAPVDAEVTRPRSVLPLTQDVFVYSFAFYLAYGFAMRYEQVVGNVLADWPVVLLMVALVVYALQTRVEVRVDTLFKAAFTLLFAGFMLLLLDDPSLAYTTSLVLVCSSTVFDPLINLALGAVAARNHANALPAIAWGYAVHFVGIELGAQLGIMVTGLPDEAHLATRATVAIVLAAIVLYTLFSIHDFGFDKTIASIEPGGPLEVPAETKLVDTVDARCTELANEHGLTERESEVFGLLARGHNTPHIQKTLGITKNTLKYHVRHIYEKCGVHSQQELIELL